MGSWQRKRDEMKSIKIKLSIPAKKIEVDDDAFEEIRLELQQFIANDLADVVRRLAIRKEKGGDDRWIEESKVFEITRQVTDKISNSLRIVQ
tara:strand:- start:390 stop:665 length:276 start_codon:yes stop_codon:yes gene_type:complete